MGKILIFSFKFLNAFILTGFRIEDILVNMTANVSLIQGRYAEIAIPLKEVLKGLQVETEVRITSFLLRNMSGLLPRRFGGARDNSSLRSDRRKRVN